MTALLLAAALSYPIQAGEYSGIVEATDDGAMDRQGYVPEGCPHVGDTVTYRFRWFEDLDDWREDRKLRSWEGLYWQGQLIDEENKRHSGTTVLSGNVKGFGATNDAGEHCQIWVYTVTGSHKRVDVIGDANLDGVFDSADLVQVFTAGEYEDTKLTPTGWVNRHNSFWDEGDWNGDAEFTSSDLVHAMQFNSYSAAASAVPEPSGFLLVLTAGLFFIHRGRNR